MGRTATSTIVRGGVPGTYLTDDDRCFLNPGTDQTSTMSSSRLNSVSEANGDVGSSIVAD